MKLSKSRNNFSNFLNKQPLVRVVFYYLIWELIYFTMGLPNFLSQKVKNWDNFLFNYLLIGTVNFMLFYVMSFFVIPKLYINKRKVALLIFISIFAAITFTFLKYEIEMWRFNQKMNLLNAFLKNAQPGVAMPAVPLRPTTFDSYMLTYIWFTFIIIIIAFSFQLVRVSYRQEKVRKELENQKLKAELSFLKLQINPHFLFNSLNNLYALAVIEKTVRTADGIMKLSNLIRYMLYEKEDENYRVGLDKEIDHINSYIDLQKLRHEGNINIEFSIEGDTVGKKIPSLLLFPIIENSCKHGILLDAEKPVALQIKITEDQFYFSAFNHKNNFEKDPTGGIGLENVRKRLSLLYPGNHSLTIKENEQTFLVEIKLPLK